MGSCNGNLQTVYQFTIPANLIIYSEILLLYLDVILIQQTDDSRKREFCFSDLVRFRVDGVVERCSKVSFFEHCVFECGLPQITGVENGAGEIAFGEIGLVYLAVFETCFFDLCSEERSMVQCTSGEAEGEAEGIAVLEMEAQHFAIFKMYILKGSFVQLCQADITRDEFTLREANIREIGI